VATVAAPDAARLLTEGNAAPAPAAPAPPAVPARAPATGVLGMVSIPKRGAAGSGAHRPLPPSLLPLRDASGRVLVGCALKHPHPLVLGRYSVHSNRASLAQGEANIVAIGQQLRRDGRI
jgi:hypothetical protein